MQYLGAADTPTQKKALDAIGEYQRQAAAIRNDTNLTETGRDAALARAYIRALDTATDAKATEEGTAAARRTTLEREVFGITGTADANTAISYRDAQDRAASIVNMRDAERLLNQAQLSGDTHLAKAVAHRALQDGWTDILATYANATPGFADKIQQLIDLTPTIASSISAGMVFTVDRPRELAHLSDTSIRAIAAGQQPVESTFMQGW
jgi:hypothetical protein